MALAWNGLRISGPTATHMCETHYAVDRTAYECPARCAASHCLSFPCSYECASSTQELAHITYVLGLHLACLFGRGWQTTTLQTGAGQEAGESHSLQPAGCRCCMLPRPLTRHGISPVPMSSIISCSYPTASSINTNNILRTTPSSFSRPCAPSLPWTLCPLLLHLRTPDDGFSFFSLAAAY